MSAVRVTKIRDFDVTPPRKSAFQIETPPDVPRQHSLTIFSARRGGGKSVACTSYVKKLLEVGAMQRVIIITPTWASNKDIFAPLNIKEEDIIEPSKSALATVVARVEQEKKEHDEYLSKRRKYTRSFRRLCEAPLALKQFRCLLWWRPSTLDSSRDHPNGSTLTIPTQRFACLSSMTVCRCL